MGKHDTIKPGDYVALNVVWDKFESLNGAQIIVKVGKSTRGHLVIDNTNVSILDDDGNEREFFNVSPLTPDVLHEMRRSQHNGGEIRDGVTKSLLVDMVKSAEKFLAEAREVLAWMEVAKLDSYDSVQHDVYRAITAMQHSEDKTEASRRIAEIIKRQRLS